MTGSSYQAMSYCSTARASLIASVTPVLPWASSMIWTSGPTASRASLILAAETATIGGWSLPSARTSQAVLDEILHDDRRALRLAVAGDALVGLDYHNGGTQAHDRAEVAGVLLLLGDRRREQHRPHGCDLHRSLRSRSPRGGRVAIGS